jgi:hypothetical protein
MKLKLPRRIEASVSNIRPFIGIKTSHTLLKERTFFLESYDILLGVGFPANPLPRPI